MTVEVARAHDGTAVGQDNARFIELLLKCRKLVIAGQAKSHCVNFFINTLNNRMNDIDPTLLRKVYIVEDLTSNVVIYGPQGERIVDFTEAGNNAIERYRQSGMNVVRSTTPIWNWPGFMD
jgi:nicotinamidase-related amidase